MKRKLEFTNIEITLPSKKRVKIPKITIKLDKMTSESEYEEINQTIRCQLYPNNQQGYFDSISEDSDKGSEYHYTASEKAESDKTKSDNETIIKKMQEEFIFTNNDDIVSVSTEQNIIRTPESENKYDKIAKELSTMNRYLKGEAMELKIKEQLEAYGFIVTKTQSTCNKQ